MRAESVPRVGGRITSEHVFIPLQDLAGWNLGGDLALVLDHVLLV